MRTRPRDPLIPVTVIDRPSRDADHLFVAEYQGHQVVGALGADWQRNPARRTRAGLPGKWEDDVAAIAGSGPRLRGSLEVPRESKQMEEVEFFEVAERPMFVVPESARHDVGDGHGNDAAVTRVHTWYQAAWTVVAMTQLIGECADIRAAMLRAGSENTTDFQNVELELSQARLSITKARAILRSAHRA